MKTENTEAEITQYGLHLQDRIKLLMELQDLLSAAAVDAEQQPDNDAAAITLQRHLKIILQWQGSKIAAAAEELKGMKRAMVGKTTGSA